MPVPNKVGKKTRILILSLSPEALARFPADDASTSDSGVKRSGNATTSQIQADTSLDDRSDSNTTPAPPDGEGTEAQSKDDKKKKPNPTGRKRAPPAIDPDGPARDRARPGPKKKARLTDGPGDNADAAKLPLAAASNNAVAAAAHKLGPKANTGAINAGLRALDRSGKPCRRWEKKGLQLKSFTGTVWSMASWKGSHRAGLNADGEVESDSSSDIKLDVSAVVSEKSASGDALDTIMSNGAESSPALPIAV